MSEEIPKILVLSAIAPSAASAKSDKLVAPKLVETNKKHLPYEYARMHEFWDAADGSTEEEKSAENLAVQYMLLTAQKANEAVTPEDRKLWADRYTQATREKYGEPEVGLAKQLVSEQASNLLADFESSSDVDAAVKFKELCEKYGIVLDEYDKVEPPSFEAAAAAHDYLNNTYSKVFAALELDEEIELIPPEQIFSKFRAAIDVLAQDFDPGWAEWAMEFNKEEAQLRIIPEEKKIIIGAGRVPVTPKQLKGLFAHEILIHGTRAQNGYKLSEELGTGLAGYLDAEEGLGVFAEYAITGEIPEKNIDRYVDIALALGLIDGHAKTRAEMLEFAMSRADLRNTIDGNKKSTSDIETEVYAHINRIYRGSRGDNNIGIFTKDVSYHRGFTETAEYITKELAQGKSISDIMEFLSLGKFDPNNEAHLRVLQQDLEAVR